jgi:Secretion system C-terminal sorting domain/PKD-like domain
MKKIILLVFSMLTLIKLSYSQCNPTITVTPNSTICTSIGVAEVSITATTGAPNAYNIDWSNTLNEFGIIDVPYTSFNFTLPAIIPLNLHPALPPNTYSGILRVRNSSGCVSAAYTINITIDGPTIDGTSLSNVCPGTTNLTLNYQLLTGSPDLYSVDWNSIQPYSPSIPLPTDIPFTPLPSTGGIPLGNAPTIPGTYGGTLVIRNSITGCENSRWISYTVGPQISISTNNKIVCSGTSTTTLTYSQKTLGADKYKIDWDNAANAEGMLDVGYIPIPENAIPITNIPSVPGKYTGMLYAKNSILNCEGPGQPIDITVGSSIVLASQNSNVCIGESYASFHVIGPNTGSPNMYRVDWSSASLLAGFNNIPFTSFTTIIEPTISSTAPVGTYSGTLYVKNNSANCESIGLPITVIVNGRPSITMSSMPTICKTSNSVQFNYTSTTGSPTQYKIQWSPSIVGLSDISYTTLQANSISISNIPTNQNYQNIYGLLYVKNASGCQSSPAVQVTIQRKTPSISSLSELSVCTGTTSTMLPYYATDFNPNQYQIIWSAPAVTAGLLNVPLTTLPLNQINISSIPLTPGTYYGTLYAKNTTENCISGVGNTSPINLTVSSKPSATITPASTTTFCSGGSVVLNANTGTGLTYQWIKNGIDILGATSSSYIATETGNFTVRITNSSTCASTSASTLVTVNPLPVALITTPSNSICQGGSVTLIANTGSGLTHQWFKNGINISGATSSSYSVTQPGDYTVRLTNSIGCYAVSSPITLTLTTLPIVSTSNKTICSGQSTQLTLTSDVSSTTYSWSVLSVSATISGVTAGTTTYNANPINHTLTNSSGNSSGVVTYRVTPTANGCSGIAKDIIVTVGTNPSSPISAVKDLCTHGYTDLTTGAGSGYVWASSETTQTIRVYSQGTYSVNYLTTAGCLASASIFVEFIQRPGQTCIYARQASPEKEEIGKEVDSHQIHLYPNPANHEVNIQLPAAVKKTTPVEIYDTFGRVVYQSAFNAGEKTKTVSTSTFADGIYMLQLITPEGTKVVRKVMVTHR